MSPVGVGRAWNRTPPPLLELVTMQALDADYREVARRRERRARLGGPGAPPERRRSARAVTTVVAVAVFGLLVTVAGLQTSRSASAEESNRASLVTSINGRRETVARLLERTARLRAGNAGLTARRADLVDADARAQADLRRLRIRTGLAAVHGPGLRITVTDARGSGPDTPEDPDRSDGLVKDEDLALLANGLWEAGAEAISIDGQRLTAADAIRNVGIVPQVDGVPLRSPYVVLAIGNRRTLEADLYQTTTGLAFQSTADFVGIDVDVNDVDDVAVAPAPPRQLRLRSASPATPTGKPPSDQEAGP